MFSGGIERDQLREMGISYAYYYKTWLGLQNSNAFILLNDIRYDVKFIMIKVKIS